MELSAACPEEVTRTIVRSSVEGVNDKLRHAHVDLFAGFVAVRHNLSALNVRFRETRDVTD